MEIEIRPIVSEEVLSWIDREYLAFGEKVSEAEIQAEAGLLDPGCTLAAWDASEIVGGAARTSFELTVPGAVVPMAAIISVWVVPTHRRRGVLKALMRRQLDDVRQSGERVAALHASEGWIYGRFGYGMAEYSCRLEIDRRHAAFARSPGEPARLRLLSRADALDAFPKVYERLRLHRPGMPGQSRPWWEYWLRETSPDADHAPRLFVACESEGELEGYVIYRFREQWADSTPKGTIEVKELLAVTTEAYATLWRYCFDMDLTVQTRASNRPIDEPLLLMLAEPRRLRLTVSDGLWIRLVDLPKALAARRYGVEASLVMEVTDEFC
ncbi:MAG: GNAT family N-acetyltransferase, partial [Actinomycetota bacterium]